MDFKNSNIFTQIQQKRPYQTPVVASFRDTYAPTSRKYLSTEPKTKSFQFLNKNFLGDTNSVKWNHLGQIPNFKKIDLGQLLSDK